ncbi:c-type cytochrome [Occallatibacter riparius]|uniref:c-type cytochrome n=1 Tax=Occallatibacter riparius TaxID=1002689 RepID=UPI0036F4149D
MRKKAVLIPVLSLAAVALVGASLAASFDLSAVPEPGRVETTVANEAKNFLVHREARRSSIKEPSLTQSDLDNAQNVFGSECATCHGNDGRTPTDIGRGLYPRAPDLGNDEVQHWSDPEMFWIIRNGLRLTGMPAFGKQLTDQETWSLVRYLRTLRTSTPKS